MNRLSVGEVQPTFGALFLQPQVYTSRYPKMPGFSVFWVDTQAISQVPFKNNVPESLRTFIQDLPDEAVFTVDRHKQGLHLFNQKEVGDITQAYRRGGVLTENKPYASTKWGYKKMKRTLSKMFEHLSSARLLPTLPQLVEIWPEDFNVTVDSVLDDAYDALAGCRTVMTIQPQQAHRLGEVLEV